MLTSEEIERVPLFASLSAADRERLAQVLRRRPARRGRVRRARGRGAGALRRARGQDRGRQARRRRSSASLGERLPGAIFGEVPITLGTAFPSGFRASEPSRVMRVEARDYYAVAAVAPEVAMKVGALARERIGGLQGVAAEAPQPRALRARPPLGRGLLRPAPLPRPQPDHVRMDHARRAGRRRALGRRAAGTTPTARRSAPPTAPRSSDPTLRAVAELLGLQTRAAAGEYDAVVIGAGPAGLAAAVYGASEGLRTIVIEREAPGGQAGSSSRIENYLGFPAGVSGDELASARSSRRAAWARRSWSRARSPASTRARDRSTSTAATSCARARSSSPPA